MVLEPTRGAVEVEAPGWVGRPMLATLIRGGLFLAPLIIGWLAVRYTQEAYWQPSGWFGYGAWVVQAIIVAGVSSHLGAKLANRLAPLTALFKMTLVFPDHAPSRFSVALRGGTVKKLRAGETLSSSSVQAAAEHAISLVSELGRHERLTRGHTERVRAHAELIGLEMGLSDWDMNRLRWGVLLHDIGKLTVPAEILNKEGKLTDEEWRILREHPAAGERMIEPLRPWLGEWADAAGQHHERWDGKGYPAGLVGTEISLAGRITAVADAYDVITSNRSYKQAMSTDAARRELVDCSGDQFDPAVVRAMLRVGLREPRRIGLFSWVFELPQVLRLASNVATAPVAAAPAAVAAAVVTVTAAVGGAAVAEDEAPPALAAAEPVVIVETTTTTLPPTTTLVEELLEVTSSTAAPTVSTSTAPTTSTSTPESTTTSTTSAPSTTSAAPVPIPTTTTVAVATSTTTTAAAAPVAAAAVAPTTTTTTSSTTTTTTTTTTTSTTTTTTTTTTPPPPAPTGSGFQLVAVGDLPAELREDEMESGTDLFLFQEAESEVLAAAVTVKSAPDGVEVNGSHATATTIPSGTSVCVWFVHADPNGLGIDFDATIDFGVPILGIAMSTADLGATSGFEVDSVDYTYNSWGTPDTFERSGTAADFHSDYGFFDFDQMRVFTAC